MYLLQIILSACILFAVSEALPTAYNLPNELVKKNTTSRYKIISYDKKTWYGALHACHALGLELASIHSQEDHDSLKTLILSTGIIKEDWWTAGNNLDNEDFYFWLSKGFPFAFTRWANGYRTAIPNDRCVLFYSQGAWYNYRCTFATYFVCED